MTFLVAPLAPVAFEVLAGLCLGSYAATAGLRLARREQSVSGRSRCDHCGASLGFLQTAPVIAYLRQGGACRNCGGRIDPLHLVGEICGALILVLAFLLATPPRAALLAALGLTLLASAVVDAKTRRLPDSLTLACAGLCAGLALQSSSPNLAIGLAASALSFIVLEVVRRGFLGLRGRAGLGLGDVKLVAALALWLGAATPWAVALAAIIGLISMALIRPADGRLAFGPALALVGWAVGMGREAGLWPGWT
ncbi:MAG: prepilin peptidase [Caulobacteraceae bacterium]|nr:prepilin peptidase [Caulobacteraceae bacterium]